MTRLSIDRGHLNIVVLLAAACGVAASSWYYCRSAERLETAARNLHQCKTLAAKIADAAQTPQRARLESRSIADLGTTIEKAATDAQLARDRVLRIDPQAAKRLGKTDYLEQATEVELSAVTLRQIVEFVYNLARTDEQLHVRTLRLRMPHDAGNSTAPELWLADIVLTQRIYAPTTVKR